MAESTKVTSIVKDTPKFDGNPIKYASWKETTLAFLEISRSDMHEILTGESVRPAEQYTSTTTPEGRGRDATVDPAPSGQAVEGDGSEGAKTATEAGKEGTPGTPAVVSSSHGDSPAEETEHLELLNATEIKAWDKTNAALYSVLLLVTSGAARCLLRQYAAKKGHKADGREAWLALNRKYENTSSHRRQTLMTRLGNSRMEEGSDPDIFFRKIDQLCEELEVVDEHVSQHRKMDIIMSGMPPEYELIRFQAMKDPEFSLEELQLTMRNMHMNGYTTSKRNGRGTAMTAGSMKHDKSKVKCHSCGKLGHYQYECTKTGAGSRPSSNSRKFKPRQNDSTGKKKWCSFHESDTHDDNECNAQKKKDRKSKASRGKQQEHKSSASTAAEEDNSDTVSKKDIARVFKEIGIALHAREEDQASSDQEDEENQNPMGFSFTAAGHKAEQAHLAAWDSNKITMLVDTGASDHYIDDKLAPGIKDMMSDYRPVIGTREITGIGQHTLYGTHTGTVNCQIVDSSGKKQFGKFPITLVPGLGKHLLSSGAAKEKGFHTLIKDPPTLEKGELSFPLRQVGTLFEIDIKLLPQKKTSQQESASLAAGEDTQKWHRRLGHLNEASMKTLRDTPGSGVQFQEGLKPCDTCKLGKSAQRNHPKTATVKTSSPFELIYTDLAGPFKPKAKDGSCYISKFTDHHTRWKAVYPIASKDKALDTLAYFNQDYVIPSGHRIQRVRCDKGGEYVADYFRNYCKETGIQMEFAATNTPQQNGVSERDGRTILNMTRCILIDTGLPKFLWGEICETAVFLINRSPHRALEGNTPYSRLFGKEADLSGLRAIGARAFVHKERQGNKLEEKAWEGVMIGYSKDSRSYRVYNPHNRRITESRNVTFIETPRRALSQAGQNNLLSSNDEEDETNEDYRQDVLSHLSLLDAGTGTVETKDEDKKEPRPIYYEGSPSPPPSIGSGGMDSTPPSPKSGGTPYDGGSPPENDNSGAHEDIGSTIDDYDSGDTPGDSETPPDDTKQEDEEEQDSTSASSPLQPVVSLNRTLRSKGAAHSTPSINTIDSAGLEGKTRGELKRLGCTMKGWDDSQPGRVRDQAHTEESASFVEYAYVTETTAQSNPDPASITLPNTFKEAKASAYSPQWTKAMERELASLKENNVYDLIPRQAVPAGCKVIGSRWVYKVKSDYTFKARLVCQGYAQRPGIDCGATFAPVCRIESQRILMAIACHYDWDIIMLDVKTAFLQSPIDTPTYVRQPPGYEKMDAQGKPMIMNLKQAVYGLRTASRVWHLTLDKALQDIGFKATKTDPCMYISEIEGGYCILTIYVDDILITAPDKNFLARTKKKLMDRFTMSDLGEVSLILGMKITRDRVNKTLSISQTDYAMSILERFGMQDCNPVSTPSYGTELSLNQPADSLLDEDGIKAYQSLVGCLLYLSRTSRWDISYAVLELTRATSKPSKAHWTKAKHVLRYIKGRPQLDIVYRSGKFNIQAWADASFAQDLEKRRSTSGYLFLLSGAPISWCSALQSLTALSTVEAEMVSISYAAREACHIQDMLFELGFGERFSQIAIGNDSTGALSLVSNNSYSARTKHLQLRKWFTTQLIESGRLVIYHVASSELPADLFTKNCTRAIHRKLVEQILAYSSSD